MAKRVKTNYDRGYVNAMDKIPQVNLTRTDIDSLGDVAEALAECGCFGACDFLRRVQSEVTKIVEYQEER